MICNGSVIGMLNGERGLWYDIVDMCYGRVFCNIMEGGMILRLSVGSMMELCSCDMDGDMMLLKLVSPKVKDGVLFFMSSKVGITPNEDGSGVY